MKRYFIISLLSLLPALQVLSQELYTEKYRPQYHYTPASRWIGDPCGLMKHNGKYLAYCWGAAESTDLVHWTELNDNAITNLPKDIAPFTGSVVIDRNNTAGYGKNAAIAAFTSFDKESKKQSHSIEFSLNGVTGEQYFDGDLNGITFGPDQPIAEPLYVDHGLDYYASRVFQNFDADTHRVFTLGWVNTWDYANTAPSTWGKGIWSLPREYTLRTTSQGLRLYQSPCEALQSLRGTKSSATLRVKPGKSPLREISKMTNTYELLAEITPAADNDDVVGFHFCEAAGRKVVVSYDTASGTLLIDRTNSTDAQIPKFSRIAQHKVRTIDGTLKLHIFVDKSTIEIFANDGEDVFTLLTFADTEQNAASIFSLTGKTKVKLTAWPLKSIWQ